MLLRASAALAAYAVVISLLKRRASYREASIVVHRRPMPRIEPDAPITHAEFMDVFWACDGERGDDPDDWTDPGNRPIMVLDKLHRSLFGTTINECHIDDD
jgi:hypothetical protein